MRLVALSPGFVLAAKAARADQADGKPTEEAATVKADGHVPQTLRVASTPDWPLTVLAALPLQ